MRYLIFFICLLFYIGVSAQNKKPLNVICDRGDTTKGHPPLSAVGLDSSDPAHVGGQVWFIMLKGKRIFNFTWNSNNDSKLDFANIPRIRSVNIKLDNDSLVVLYLSSSPRMSTKEYLWVQSGISLDQIKQFTDHKILAIAVVADDDIQYPLLSFNEAEQGAIEAASQCFLFNTK
jgi:hypothetical protein